MPREPLQSLHNLGMYDEPSAGVQVGAYNLRPQRPGYVWIEHDSGEGMEVKTQLLESVIRRFYAEHF